MPKQGADEVKKHTGKTSEMLAAEFAKLPKEKQDKFKMSNNMDTRHCVNSNLNAVSGELDLPPGECTPMNVEDAVEKVCMIGSYVQAQINEQKGPAQSDEVPETRQSFLISLGKSVAGFFANSLARAALGKKGELGIETTKEETDAIKKGFKQ